MRTLIFILAIWSNITFMVQAQELKEKGEHKDFVLPGTKIGYTLADPEGGTIKNIEWTVTGGSFNELSDVTSIKYSKEKEMTVYWRNPKATGTNAPQGTISAKIDYTVGNTDYNAEKKLVQKIKSYNGVTPPPLRIKGGKKTIPLGAESFVVELTSPFNLPYIIDDEYAKVDNLEWIMPKSWYGNDTVIKNTASSISVTPDYFTDGVIKVRGINPEYEKDKTAFSSITVKREFNYSAYPATIQYGVSQTFTYTVPVVSGVAYEWSVPSGWTIVSGANTNSIRVTKSPCATSADVKVRLKNGNKYSGWFMAPNTTVLPPNLTIPSIEQFRDISISVDIPSDKIESFTITGTGVSIVGGQSTNTLVCRFDNVGSQEINISLKLKECGSPYTLKKTVDVSKIQLEITGLDGICPSSQTYNYSISDLPAGATVSWSCGNHISIVGSSSGNNCSVKGTSGGGSAIFAHVTVRGVTVRIDKDVVVSTPLNDPYAKVSIDYSKESNNKLMLIAKLSQIYGVLGFIWNATPIGTGYSYSTQTGPSGDYWTIPNGNYNIELRVITHCGLLLQTRAVYGVGSYAFSVYPNPADRTLFVDVAEPEKTISADEAVWAPKTASTSYELRLFNFQGLLVRNLRMTDRQASIDVSGLPGGNYFLHIFRDGVAEPEVHKVIVSH